MSLTAALAIAQLVGSQQKAQQQEEAQRAEGLDQQLGQLVAGVKNRQPQALPPRPGLPSSGGNPMAFLQALTQGGIQ